jgi:hypothetical protein
MNTKLPLMALRVYQQSRLASARPGPVAVAGSSELVPLVAKELREGGDDRAVVEGPPAGHAAALVWIGPPDLEVLRAASRSETPIVALTEGQSVPYVLDTNIVRIPPGRGLPVAETIDALARVLGPVGPSVAARLPALRGPVVHHLVKQSSLRNGLIGAATFVPGPDLPALTLNQIFLTIRMAVAAGRDADIAVIWPELAAVAATGFAWRKIARGLELLPVPRSVVRGGVALGGTWLVAEALRHRLSVRPRS